MRRKKRDSSDLVQPLLHWFARSARDLPWRRTRDPYAIWVSEIMLQQTQVKTVIPYWERWMKRLPTIRSLARANSRTIHKLWEGLGYYTRVRNMQKAARTIVRDHGGEFPHSFEQVLALAGIGRYTAGAICSISFDQPTPVVDGNVARVLARLFAIDGDPRDKNTNRCLWETAEALVIRAGTEGEAGVNGCGPRPYGALNQALMELGALICTPKQPRCEVCPVTDFCVASRKGMTERFPAVRTRPVVTNREFRAFVVRKAGKVLVRQRPEGVINGHLWEFPNGELHQDGRGPDHTARQIFGAKPRSVEFLCKFKHSITRYRISLEVYHAELSTADGIWLTPDQLQRLPFSSAHKKIVNLLADARSN